MNEIDIYKEKCRDLMNTHQKLISDYGKELEETERLKNIIKALMLRTHRDELEFISNSGGTLYTVVPRLCFDKLHATEIILEENISGDYILKAICKGEKNEKK